LVISARVAQNFPFTLTPSAGDAVPSANLELVSGSSWRLDEWI
jgi:hypothetical protein